MDERAVADDRIEEKPAPSAVGVVAVCVAEDHDALLSVDDPELGARSMPANGPKAKPALRRQMDQ
jgi:hypothetical protein